VVVAVISGNPQVSFVVDATMNQNADVGAGVPPGTFREIVNLRKNKDGQLVKRWGYGGSDGMPASPGATVRGFGHKNHSVAITEKSVLAYGSASDRWNTVDRTTNWTLEDATGIAGDTSWVPMSNSDVIDDDATGLRMYPGVAVGGGLIVHVWVWKQWGNQNAGPGADFPAPQQGRHGAYILVVDEKSGAVLRGPERISSAAAGTDIIDIARVAYAGGYFWIAWSKIPEYDASDTGTIYTLCKTPAQLEDAATSLGAGTAQKTDLCSQGIIATRTFASWDLCAGGTTATPKAFIAYHRNNAGTFTVNVFDISTANALSANRDITSGQAWGVSVANKVDSGYVWTAYVRDASSGVARLTQLPTSLASSNDVDLMTILVRVHSTGICPSPLNNTDVFVAATTQEAGSATPGSLMWRKATSAAGVPSTSGETLYIQDIVLGSQPFTNGSDVYVWAEIGRPTEDVTGSTVVPTAAEAVAESSMVLVDLTHDGGTIYSLAADCKTISPHLRIQAARTNWGQYADGLYDPAYGTMHAPQKVGHDEASAVDFRAYYFDGSVVLQVTPFAEEYQHNASIGATGIVTYKFRDAKSAETTAHVPSDCANLTLTSGGTVLNAYDGQQLTEVGFAQIPRVDTIDPAGSGGAAITAGTYIWAVVYEYTDSAGNIHRSAPKITAPQTVLGGARPTFVVRPLRVTRKQDYERSIKGTVTTFAADSAVQIVLYRSGAGPTQILYRAAAVINDPSQTTQTIEDSAANADVEAAPVLYYSSGEPVNEMPPCATHAVVFNNRVAAIDAEYGDRVVFSKPLRPGLGPAFSGVFETYVKGIGRLRALAEMDGTLYAFSDSAVAVAAYGDGQDALGAGSWPQPQVVTRAAGVQDARALCATHEGIIFCSSHGDPATPYLRCWLLPRGGGNIIEIGQKVMGYLKGSSTLITSGNVTATSCVNWQSEQRVVITLISGNVTPQLEYDYRNRGPDGQGVWNVSNLAAASSRVVSTSWVTGREHFLGSQDTYIYRSQWGVYEDKDTASGTPTFVPWTLETYYMKFGSLAPRGKLNFVNVEYALNATTNVRIVVVSDNGSAQTADFALTYSGLPAWCEFQPTSRRDDAGAGVRLTLSSRYVAQAKNNEDAIPRRIHIDYIPVKGMRRPAATESV
jgi:hypothetical protein